MDGGCGGCKQAVWAVTLLPRCCQRETSASLPPLFPCCLSPRSFFRSRWEAGRDKGPGGVRLVRARAMMVTPVLRALALRPRSCQAPLLPLRPLLLHQPLFVARRCWTNGPAQQSWRHALPSCFMLSDHPQPVSPCPFSLSSSASSVQPQDTCRHTDAPFPSCSDAGAACGCGAGGGGRGGARRRASRARLPPPPARGACMRGGGACWGLVRCSCCMPGRVCCLGAAGWLAGRPPALPGHSLVTAWSWSLPAWSSLVTHWSLTGHSLVTHWSLASLCVLACTPAPIHSTLLPGALPLQL